MNPVIDIIIPIYKPDARFLQLLNKLLTQTIPPHHIYLLQTIVSEGDPLVSVTEDCISVHPILQKDFDHGATRHYGMTLSQSEYVMCMTQDAMPANEHLLEELAQALQDPKTGIAYGRQLAREQADIVEQLTRNHSYPPESRIKTKEDIQTMGIHAYFCSDVCAMYRHSLYNELGGFVHPTIFNEDMIMASKVLNEGYQVAYCGQAEVIHSHNYTCMQQFHRNFDLGVSQKQYHEIFDVVSSEKAGASFAKETIIYLVKHGRLCKAFYFALQCGFKLFGYKLGKKYDKLPKKMVLACTMNRGYW